MIHWTKELSVEEHELDGHHQHMLTLINKLDEALTYREPIDIVREVIAELKDYAAYHFGEEEAMFEFEHFPEAAIHKSLHGEFCERIEQFDRRIQSGDPAAGRQLLEFLVAWWPNHIRQFDRKYIPFVHH